jgi:hypothetical protein
VRKRRNLAPDGHDILVEESRRGDAGVGMTLRIAALVVIPLIVLVVLLLLPDALFVLPSFIVDFLIGIVIILPIAALQTWQSRKT